MKVANYRPKAYHILTTDEAVCVDDSNDGDYFVCPYHPGEIIYVMGRRFWQLEGGGQGGGWHELALTGYCHSCWDHVKFTVGSYGG